MNSSNGKLREVLLKRLPRYHQFLHEHIDGGGGEYVSSSQIAEFVGLDDTQVRKDLASIGLRGQPRVGFPLQQVMAAIHDLLGFDGEYNAIIIGAGRLGGAIALYPGFSEYGLRIVGIYDSSEILIGTYLYRNKIKAISDLEEGIKKANAQLAILTVPRDAAQDLVDRVVAAGIRAIWNFAPTTVIVPEGVTVKNENLSVGLSELIYYLKQDSE